MCVCVRVCVCECALVDVLTIKLAQCVGLQQGHGLLEVLLSELALLVHDQVQALCVSGEEVVLQGHGTVVRVHHVTRLVVDLGHPVSKKE